MTRIPGSANYHAFSNSEAGTAAEIVTAALGCSRRAASERRFVLACYEVQCELSGPLVVARACAQPVECGDDLLRELVGNVIAICVFERVSL